MPISPLKPVAERAVQVTAEAQPSRTYALDLESGEVGGIVDGKEAVRQFVRKAIATARFRFPIYSDQYGCELEDLIGQDVPLELLQTEIPRVIKEALIYDDRIRSVSDFVIERSGDVLSVSFSVETREGTINEEVTI